VDPIAILRRGFAGASLAWAAALPLAPFAASRPVASSVVYLLTFAVYAIGSVICHQRPERSFFLWSHQMPVCARCAGIYAGAAFAVIVHAAGLKPRAPGGTDGARASRRASARTALAVAAMPAIATLVYEWTTGVMPSNWTRAASGVCLGIGVAALIQREVN
jgi:uncharacterized membrane protein